MERASLRLPKVVAPMTPPEQRRAVEVLATALHPEGDSPTVDCCMGSTVEALYPEQEAEVRHREYHRRDATDLLQELVRLGYRLVPATEPAAPDTERVPLAGTDDAEPTPIRRLESALKNRATTDGEVVSLMNLLGDALHEARHEICACAAQAGPSSLDVERLAEALDALADEEYNLMAPEQREERYEAAEQLASAYARLSRTGEPSDAD